MREKRGKDLQSQLVSSECLQRGSHHYGFLLVPTLSDACGILRGGSPAPTRVLLCSIWNVVDLRNLCI